MSANLRLWWQWVFNPTQTRQILPKIIRSRSNYFGSNRPQQDLCLKNSNSIQKPYKIGSVIFFIKSQLIDLCCGLKQILCRSTNLNSSMDYDVLCPRGLAPSHPLASLSLQSALSCHHHECSRLPQQSLAIIQFSRSTLPSGHASSSHTLSAHSLSRSQPLEQSTSRTTHTSVAHLRCTDLAPATGHWVSHLGMNRILCVVFSSKLLVWDWKSESKASPFTFYVECEIWLYHLYGCFQKLLWLMLFVVCVSIFTFFFPFFDI